MNAVCAIAFREVLEGIRNRWVIGATLALTLLAVTLAFLGSTPAGTVKASALSVTVVSLASLSIFLVPLIALFLSYGGIAGEAERGTLLLLLSYPVSRAQVIAGKFLGYAAIMAFAVLFGYGGAGLAVWLFQGGSGWAAYLVLIGSSILLGLAFTSIGLLISTAVRESAIAAGVSVAVWLVFVLLFDMALLALLAADSGQSVDAALVPWLLMLNPTDVYRFLNLTLIDEVRSFSGMAGLQGAVAMPPTVLVAALLAWILVPLGLAIAVFMRRSIR